MKFFGLSLLKPYDHTSLCVVVRLVCNPNSIWPYDLASLWPYGPTGLQPCIPTSLRPYNQTGLLLCDLVVVTLQLEFLCPQK